MEAIIGFVILFWIITSVAGVFGKNQQGRKPGRRIPGMPTFGGPDITKPQSPEQRHAPAPAAPAPQPTLERTQPSVRTNVEPVTGVRSDPIQVTQDRKRIESRLITSSKGIGDVIGTEVESAEPPTNPMFNQQHVVNGIIWSEILGKPKSRRGMR